MTTPSNFSIRCSPPRPQRYCTSPRSTMAWMHLLPRRAASRAGRRPFGLFQEALSLSGVWWRRGRDSNPRYGYPYAAFRVRCFQPLSHLSIIDKPRDPAPRRKRGRPFARSEERRVGKEVTGVQTCALPVLRHAQGAGHSDYFRKHLVLAAFGGGEGGIRTPDTVTRMPHFECGAFNHSATSPSLINLEILRLDASAEGHLLPLCYHFFLEAPVYSLSRRGQRGRQHQP